MLHKLKTRLKSRAGFSLAEVLVAILILVLVTAIVAEGVPTALRAYDRAVTSANAQALINTAMTKLRNELGTASDVDVDADGTTIDYTVADGTHSRLTLDLTNGIMLQEYIGLSTDPQYTHRLVSRAASNQNLYVTYDAVSETGGVVTFTNLAVYRDGESGALTSIDSYKIRVLADSAS